MTLPYMPDSAPFTPPQRAWLSGYFAAMLTGGSNQAARTNSSGLAVAASSPATTAAPAEAPPEDFPWHDPALPLVQRLKLSEGRPHARRLMSAMAQLNCGACGYLCQSYSEAIASGSEKDLTKCSPGGTDTAKAVRELIKIELVKIEAAQPAVITREGQPVPTALPAPVKTAQPAAEKPFTRDNPVSARLVSSARLTHPDAPKDTRHVVIDLLDSGLRYEPGDSLGILPENDAHLVTAVIDLLGATGGETVQLTSGKRTSFRHALANEFTLSRCPPPVFELLVNHATDRDEKETLGQLVAADENPLTAADLAEVLDRFPSARPPVQELLPCLRRLQPRLYSISSSQRLHPHEVHLTVGVVRFESLGRWRQGVASNFLGVRSQPGEEVRVFLQPSRFRLPADPQTPVIMIGPGTGIAPFRAFLEERAATSATGKTWLFFGNQHFDCDFLYKDELSRFLDTGVLTRLELAFSRDTAERIYVQHRMLEHGEELWRWLQDGANVYVCGDARRMAVDVHNALKRIAQIHGGHSLRTAEEYVAELVASQRYRRDVY